MFRIRFFLWIRFWRIYSFDVVVISDPRSFSSFFLRVDPDTYADYFPVWGDYRCPRPGLDFYASFRSETPVLNPFAVVFFMASGSVKFVSGS
jgi:hypothetical protein